MEHSRPGPAPREPLIRPAGTIGPVARPEDRPKVSEAGRPSAETVGEANPLRAARLAEIQTMIDGGTYETTERLEAALSRFLTAVGGHS